MTQLPFSIVHAHVRMLPRLQAREALRAVTITALGSGAVKREDSAPILRTWRRAAEFDGAPAEQPKRMWTEGEIEAMGIEVVKVPARG